MSVCQYWVSEIDYNELTNSNRMAGNLFYLLWSLMLLLVISNVFIAILCEAYVAVKIGYYHEEDLMRQGRLPLPKTFYQICKEAMQTLAVCPEKVLGVEPQHTEEENRLKQVADKMRRNSRDHRRDLHRIVSTMDGNGRNPERRKESLYDSMTAAMLQTQIFGEDALSSDESSSTPDRPTKRPPKLKIKRSLSEPDLPTRWA